MNRKQRRAAGQRGPTAQAQNVRVFPPQAVPQDQFEAEHFGVDEDHDAEAYQAYEVIPLNGGPQVQVQVDPGKGVGLVLNFQAVIPPDWLEEQPSKLALTTDPRTGQPTSGAMRMMQEFFREKLGLLTVPARIRFSVRKGALKPPTPKPAPPADRLAGILDNLEPPEAP